jgi:hypothetical protein
MVPGQQAPRPAQFNGAIEVIAQMGNLLPLNISINEGRAAEESRGGLYVNGFFKSIRPGLCERRRMISLR